MAKAKILFVDNAPDFLETRREFLEREGYTVVAATSPNEARDKLASENPDLAILDIRLENDDDEKDVSGLMLAQEIGRLVPVLLLTGYSAVEYARQALKPQLDGFPAAYDFVEKEQGPAALLIAVRNTLQIAENRKRVVTESIREAEKISRWQQWRPVAAMIALLLALGAGVSAMVFGEPSWLFGTVACAILSVVLIGLGGQSE